jgi:hypothetical protein
MPVNYSLHQGARGALAVHYLMASCLAPSDVAPRLGGLSLAHSVAARLSSRGRNVIDRLARRHAGEQKFQDLCKNLQQ